MVGSRQSLVEALTFDPLATFNKYNMPYAFSPANEDKQGRFMGCGIALSRCARSCPRLYK